MCCYDIWTRCWNLDFLFRPSPKPRFSIVIGSFLVRLSLKYSSDVAINSNMPCWLTCRYIVYTFPDMLTDLTRVTWLALGLFETFVLFCVRILNCTTVGPVWARGRCRISPPRFLTECCKWQLNQGSFVLLYFRLFTFFWFVLSLYFPVLFC